MSEDYFGSPITQYENGCQMGLRMKLALDFLKVPGFIGSTPEADVKRALAVANELVEQSLSAGYMVALPESADLSVPFKRHIERAARANLYQQQVTQRIIGEVDRETPGLLRVPPGAHLPPLS